MYLSQLRTYSRMFTGWITGCVAFLLLLNPQSAKAQPNTTIDLKKPPPYEIRTLPSERTGEKKFTAGRRFYNNMVSRFNYYFVANLRMNEVLDKAKAYNEDYTQLLPFYKFSINVTAKNRLLDSVIYECTAGILLHDLRSDWVDKLYLLMGKAYLLKKNFDSAAVIFQYINYAFSPKDDGYDIPIGSNASNTNGVFTIATKESKKLWKKITSIPPSRNESFILQAWDYIEQKKYVEAGSLLEILRTDPNFPARLHSYLHEMTAYVLYMQQSYEGSATEITKALVKPDNRAEIPRWEYLAGQLYEKAGDTAKAIALYERSIRHATDPIMEVYARLNIVSLAAGIQENALQKNLDELLSMARKDRYENNRDIIYYAAAQLELRRKNYTAAQNLLLKSIQNNFNNPGQRQQSFLLLGDLNFTRKFYGLSYAYYDSIQIQLLADADQIRVKERRPALKIISENQATIARQDSLQKLAALPAEARNTFIKKLLKQLRRERGLKEAAVNDADFAASNAVNTFGNAGNSEFYFLNPSLRARGFNDFKSRFGNRPNVDNWQRQSVVDRTLNTNTPLAEQKTNSDKSKDDKDLTVEALLKNIPLTTAQKDSSNSAIIRSLLGNGLTFQNRLEDYPSAIEAYEELLRRFPESGEVEQVLFNLAYCYRKNNEPGKADATADLLKKSFPAGKFTKQLILGNAVKRTSPAEQQYANIYNMFIEGRFDEAREAKLKADKEYGKTYWTPQLLFIESIYYVKQRQDSIAINRLQNLASLFSKSPMAEKAKTMIDVLKRRREIENYLEYLYVDKNTDPVIRGVDLDSTNPATGGKVRNIKLSPPPKEINAPSRELVNLSNTHTIDIPAPEIPKPGSGPVLPKAVPLALTNNTKAEAIINNTYTFNQADSQYVVVVLDKVDPIFVTEGRNAFNRYNQERYPAPGINLVTRKINDQIYFLLFGPFANAAEAIGYIDKTRPLTPTRIIPWLTAEKYSFFIISNANMGILINQQDLDGYRTFIHQVFPDKF